MTKSNTFLSIIVASRLDDYGGNQLTRIECFMEHLSINAKYHFNDLNWELIVVDWNPPNSDSLISTLPLFRKYETLPYHFLVHELPEEQINSGQAGYQFELHAAINLGVSNAKGQHILITNFDCMFTDEIFSALGNRKISESHFYLADRFDVEIVDADSWLTFKSTIFNGSALSLFNGNGILNIRHSRSKRGRINPIAIDFPIEGKKPYKFRAIRGEITTGQIAFWSAAVAKRFRRAILRARQDVSNGLSPSVAVDDLLGKFGIHTNGSGDFILAPSKVLRELGGFKTYPGQYWHLDSDLVFRLLSKGLLHGQFISPARVLHLTSPHSGGKDPQYSNVYSYNEMCNTWLSIEYNKAF